MKTRLKKTAAVIPTPRTRAEMEELVNRIAALKRLEVRETVALDAEIAAVKEQHGDALAQIAADLKPLLTAAETWATANPAEFGKVKSVKLLHGTVGFRTTTPALLPLNKKWNWKTITAAVMHRLPNFIRNKPEVDKEAILAQREELAGLGALEACGLKVSQEETFFVEPHLTEVEKREVAK